MIDRYRYPKLYQMVREIRPSLPVRRLGLAVSGGSDSVALLRLCHCIKWTSPLELFVFHVDHGLRPTSSEEAQWVKNLAARYDLPFAMQRLTPPPELAKNASDPPETWARHARYQALAEMAVQHSVKIVATAHSLTDQVETLFLHLLRGTSLSGLGGMRPFRRLQCRPEHQPLTIWRPLLGYSRKELQSILLEIEQSWLHDPSNLTGTSLRTRIRRLLMPLLEELAPGAARRIAATCTDLHVIDRYLRQQAKRKIPVATSSELLFPDSVSQALLPFAIRRWKQRLGWQNQLTRPLMCHLLALAGTTAHGGSISAPDGDRVVRTKKGLCLFSALSEAGAVGKLPGSSADTTAHLAPGSIIKLGNYCFALSLPSNAEETRPDGHTVWLPPELCPAGLTVRKRRAGDRIRFVVGQQQHSRQLGRRLRDLGLTTPEKDRLWIVADHSQILWVPGLAVDPALSRQRIPGWWSLSTWNNDR